ncbi:MAG: hypothetical protein BWY31_03208 [Lentisphaerae bacterium ADurb.Bin242]|nr:MAG: hypothetical protein BWY31_03208 [Lentisphaerae bacterium ADurb.Bin242]
MKFKDRLWIWGQNAGSHHRVPGFRLPGVNRMESREGCEYLGIPNCCRVVLPAGPEPPFDRESEKLASLRSVVWSAVGACGVSRNDRDGSDLDEVLRQAELFPNVSGAVLDDFFASSETLASGGPLVRHSLESLKTMRDRLHSFPKRKLDLWLVWYDYQLDYPVEDYVDCCDVITHWTWNASELPRLEKNLAKARELAPGKRCFAGVYMWDYGAGKPMTVEEMRHQCGICCDWIRAGKLDGMIFCSNCIADLGLEAVEWAKKWIHEKAEEDF